jgi:ribonuclease HI
MGSAYLGKETEYTVYAAELLDILMAMSLVERHTTRRAVIFTDNQASLQAIEDLKCQSGQYIMERIIQALARNRPRGQDVNFY